MANRILDLNNDPGENALFSPEALKRYNAVVESAQILENELADALTENDRLRNVVKAQEERLNALSSREAAVANREDVVLAREKLMTDLEKKLAVAEARDSVRKEVFETIFRLPTVRRNFTDNVTMSGYAGSGSTNSTETHTVSETRAEE